MPEAKKAPAFITGGSSGIGLELARKLAKLGHSVAIFARSEAKIEAAVLDIRTSVPNADIRGYPVDVAERGACFAAVDQAIADLGAPGWAVANAGIAEPGMFVDQAAEVFEDHMAINYLGALWFAKACVPHMTTNSRMVFVSSGAAFFGIYGYSAYAPSKFAMRALAEVLRVELKPRGISVSLVYPPDTDTPMLEIEERTKPDATKAITAGGGKMQPEDVAAVILKRAAAGKFTVAPGFQMKALLALHSLIGRILRAWQNSIVRKHGG